MKPVEYFRYHRDGQYLVVDYGNDEHYCREIVGYGELQNLDVIRERLKTDFDEWKTLRNEVIK